MASRIIFFTVLLSLFALSPTAVAAPDAAEMRALSERVRADTSAHTFLQNLCDDHGGRLTGSPAARAATEQIVRELRALGYEPRLETFSMPGWQRSPDDAVEILAPFTRKLRVAALSYTQPHERFEDALIPLGSGSEKDFSALKSTPAAAIGLVEVKAEPTRDIVRRAAEHGLRGILLTDRTGGGQLLARTGGHDGKALPIPVYSITQEEGLWLNRLLKRGEAVRIAMETGSHQLAVEAKNIVLRIPGDSPETIVVGAHLDSWDLGQGAIDNGIGVAQLYAIAKNIHGLKLRRTVELVWFDGEELGIWGSRHQAAVSRGEPIVAMINLDMVGVPLAVNALGDDSVLPVLNACAAVLTDSKHPLAEGVHNVNWLGSDHTPYQLTGVRAVTFHGPIAPESVRFYHDFGDTIDKVPPALICDSSATIAAFVYWLAQDDTLAPTRRSDAATADMFAQFRNDPRNASLRVMIDELLPSAAAKLSQKQKCCANCSCFISETSATNVE